MFLVDVDNTSKGSLTFARNIDEMYCQNAFVQKFLPTVKKSVKVITDIGKNFY